MIEIMERLFGKKKNTLRHQVTYWWMLLLVTSEKPRSVFRIPTVFSFGVTEMKHWVLFLK